MRWRGGAGGRGGRRGETRREGAGSAGRDEIWSGVGGKKALAVGRLALLASAAGGRHGTRAGLAAVRN